MTADHTNEPGREPRYEGDAIVLDTRVEKIEREQTDAKRRDQQHKDEQLRLNRRIMLFTGLLVLCSAVSGGMSIWQGTIARRSANAAKKSADAATSAAHTADATLKDEQQRFRMEQRPYIWATPKPGNRARIAIGSPKNDGVYVVDVVVDIKNSGRSPALHMISTKSETRIGPHDEAMKAAKEYVPQYVDSAGNVLSMDTSDTVVTESCESARQRYVGIAGARVRFQCLPQYAPPTLTQEQIEHVVDGTWDVYIVGGVQYTDIFQPPLKQPYETTYCFHVNPKGLAFGDCTFGNLLK